MARVIRRYQGCSIATYAMIITDSTMKGACKSILPECIAVGIV